MSDIEEIDDTDFIVKTAEKTENFVKEQVHIVLKRVKSLSKNIGHLEQSLNSVYSELKSA
jgi:uncharacterized protein (UPF0335 family)